MKKLKRYYVIHTENSGIRELIGCGGREEGDKHSTLYCIRRRDTHGMRESRKYEEIEEEINPRYMYMLYTGGREGVGT